MFMPRLLKEAKKNSRLMGLSKPRPRRKVDKMKRMPMREKMEVTRSATIKALIWLGVACPAMMGVLFAGSMRALDGVVWAQRRALFYGGMQTLFRSTIFTTTSMTEPPFGSI